MSGALVKRGVGPVGKALVVEGPPIGKGRPRVTRHGTYTPARTRAWQARARTLARVWWGRAQPLQGPVRLEYRAYFDRPKRYRGPPDAHPCDRGGSHYPDLDNLIKAAADALNGIAYLDDRQVVEVTGHKLFAAAADSARVVVRVCPIPEGDPQ